MKKYVIQPQSKQRNLLISKELMAFLSLQFQDDIQIKTIRNEHGDYTIVTPLWELSQPDFMIEDLFADFKDPLFITELQDLGEARGHEQW